MTADPLGTGCRREEEGFAIGDSQWRKGKARDWGEMRNAEKGRMVNG